MGFSWAWQVAGLHRVGWWGEGHNPACPLEPSVLSSFPPSTLAGKMPQSADHMPGTSASVIYQALPITRLQALKAGSHSSPYEPLTGGVLP